MTRVAVLARAVLFSPSETFLATVPAGETWLIRAAAAYNSDPSAGILFLYVRAFGGVIVGPMFINQSIAAGASLQLSTYLVCKPGDQVAGAISTSTSCHVWVSGLRLIGVLT